VHDDLARTEVDQLSRCQCLERIRQLALPGHEIDERQVHHEHESPVRVQASARFREHAGQRSSVVERVAHLTARVERQEAADAVRVGEDQDAFVGQQLGDQRRLDRAPQRVVPMVSVLGVNDPQAVARDGREREPGDRTRTSRDGFDARRSEQHDTRQRDHQEEVVVETAAREQRRVDHARCESDESDGEAVWAEHAVRDEQADERQSQPARREAVGRVPPLEHEEVTESEALRQLHDARHGRFTFRLEERTVGDECEVQRVQGDRHETRERQKHQPRRALLARHTGRDVAGEQRVQSECRQHEQRRPVEQRADEDPRRRAHEFAPSPAAQPDQMVREHHGRRAHDRALGPALQTVSRTERQRRGQHRCSQSDARAAGDETEARERGNREQAADQRHEAHGPLAAAERLDRQRAQPHEGRGMVGVVREEPPTAREFDTPDVRQAAALREAVGDEVRDRTTGEIRAERSEEVGCDGAPRIGEAEQARREREREDADDQRNGAGRRAAHRGGSSASGTPPVGNR
jgi:hypothetical protein